jgi:beta-mannosidase
LLDFDGKVLLDKMQDVQIPAQSSAVYVSVNEKDTLGSASPDRSFMVFDLMAGGKTVSRNEVFFDRMRNLQLPLKPAIQSTVTAAGSDYLLTLRSPVLARNVYLSFGDIDATPSDNYFDLLPGEEMTIRLKSSATLAQLQQVIKVTSLTDAFFDERPSYQEHASVDIQTPAQH